MSPRLTGTDTTAMKANSKAAKASAPKTEVDHRTRVGRVRRARTRVRILEAAAHVFAKQGTESPVIDDFIRAAGVSRGTFYNHFGTTGELLDATVAWMADEITHAIDPLIKGIEDDAMRLGTAIRIYLSWAATDRKWCAFMARIPHIGRFAERRVRRDVLHGLREGVFDVSHYDVAYDLILGTSHRTIRRIAEHPRKPARTDEVVRLILRGLGVKERKIGQIMALPLPPFQPPKRRVELVH